MSTRINHNILSMSARRSIEISQSGLDNAVKRLSSGLRINNSWDDPAGLAVSERFRAQIGGLVEAERNANYNINLLATADGALSVIDEQLIRMRSLAIQASNGALTSTDREFINVEFQQLKSEITRIANVTNYNGKFLINGDLSTSGAGSTMGNMTGITENENSLKFHIGTNNQVANDYYYINLGSSTASALGIDSIDVLNTANSQAAIDLLDAAIESKDTTRTFIGALVNRLQSTILEIQVSHENAQTSETQIRDADIAVEMAEFTRAQILFNSGISMLSQANNIPQMVAQLIQG